MKTTCLWAALVLVTVSLFGCSGSNESQVAERPMTDSLTAAAVNPITAVAPGSAAAIASSATNGTSNKVEPFRNPFAPPKDPPPPIVEKPEPKPELTPESSPEIRQPGVPPKIRLLGFMNIGEPKVLVSYREVLETLAIGDTLEDMEVVGIDSPELTMLFDEREIKLSLFDQAWRHEGSSASVGSGSRGQTRPRSARPIRNTSNAASAGETAGEPTPGSSGIPGFSPHAGKPPGFRRPASSGAGSTPVAPTGSPPPSLPGLNSEATGGAEISDGGVPRIPGLDVDADRKPRAGNLPAFPGGL